MIYILTKVSITILIFFFFLYSYIYPLYRNRDVLTWIKLNFQYVLWLSGFWCHVIQLVGTNILDYSVSEFLYVISFKKLMYFWFCLFPSSDEEIYHPVIRTLFEFCIHVLWICTQYVLLCVIMQDIMLITIIWVGVGGGVIVSNPSNSDQCLMIFFISVISVLQ